MGWETLSYGTEMEGLGRMVVVVDRLGDRRKVVSVDAWLWGRNEQYGGGKMLLLVNSVDG